MVLVERVGVDGRHHAPPAEVDHVDANAVADLEHAPGPRALGQALDAADDEVRPQPPAVTAEGLDGAVRGHEQRQDVETPGPRPGHELGVRARHRAHVGQHRRLTPVAAVHERRAIGPQRAGVPEQAGAGAGGDDALPGVHEHRTIALHAVAGQLRGLSCSPRMDFTG